MGRKLRKLEILYEDNHLIVVVKPVNILSQKDITNDIDMVTIVKEYIKEIDRVRTVNNIKDKDKQPYQDLKTEAKEKLNIEADYIMSSASFSELDIKLVSISEV